MRTPEEAVLQYVENNPSVSTRVTARRFHMSHVTVWRILQEMLWSYHLERVHALTPADYPSRMHFCNWYLNQTILQADFANTVLFTDEACFTHERIYNSRNSHFWSMENPHATILRSHQHRFCVNMWARIVVNFLLGPYILPERLNASTYFILLQNVLPELLHLIPLNISRSMRFQHDGAPPHFANAVRGHLTATFCARWIGRGRPSAWLACSPDLTCLDFF